MRVPALSRVILLGAASVALGACGGTSRASDDSNHGGDTSSGGSSGSSTGGTSGSAGVPLDCGFGACQIGNTCYTDGVSGQPKGDGCNTCTCEEGIAHCTDEPCETNGDPCVSEGKEYLSGSIVPIDCNSCLCIDGELRSCTTARCPTPRARCRYFMDCDSDEICVAPSCGADGVCLKQRFDCPTLGEPVCDCWGITDESACLAQYRAQAVAHAGACQARSCTVDGTVRENSSSWESGDGCNTCRCIDGEVICTTRTCVPCGEGLPDCAGDEYCMFAYGTCGADGPGVCELRKRGSCGLEASFACGCDGQLYPNYCFAAKAGQSLADTTSCGG